MAYLLQSIYRASLEKLECHDVVGEEVGEEEGEEESSEVSQLNGSSEEMDPQCNTSERSVDGLQSPLPTMEQFLGQYQLVYHDSNLVCGFCSQSSLSLPCFSVQIKHKIIQKHEVCSATTSTPPLESTHRELSFEWSHL